MLALDRSQKATSLTVQAPIGGLNARDALAAMPPMDAIALTNLFPYADRVETRPGYSLLATATAVSPGVGLTAVEGFRFFMQRSSTTYGAWRWAEDVAGTLYQRLRVYSISSAGTITNVREIVTTGGTDSLSSSGEWSTFTSAAGTHYLLHVSTQNIGGSDTFIVTAFDGTSWTRPAVTGVSAGTLGISSHRNRVWFYGDATKPLSAYYLPTGAVAGAAVEFNLGPFASKGGTICAIRTWTIDGGDGGSDDLCAFVTTKGQLILYSGTDPSSLSTWALVGVFDVSATASAFGTRIYSNDAPPPLSDVIFYIRDTFAMKYGADLLLMLADGLSTAAGVLRPSAVDGDYSISSKIRQLLATLAVTNSALVESSTQFQWKLCYLPTRKQLLVCVPKTSTTATASRVLTATVATCTVYAMNAETGAWCQFDGMNILDAIAVGNNMYFIDGGHNVYKYGEATSDNSAAITFECRQAYNYLQSPNDKLVTLMQPMLYSTGNFSLSVEADADFKSGTISAYTSYTASNENLKPWLSPNQYGRAISGHFKGQTSAGVVSWYATTYLYRNAGVL